MMIEIGYYVQAPIAASLPETVADRFRLDFHLNKACKLREITLAETPIVDQFPDKILGKMTQVPLPMWSDYKWETPVNYTGSDVIAAADVLDLSTYLHGDTLTYAFPVGTWEVVRTYMAPTMIMNAPTLEDDGRGPEVDRWNHDALKHHYDSFVGDLLKRIPPADRTTWKVMVCDSYEKATQNYGDDFMQYFKTHFGYDPTPYLLAYDGIVVESSEKTDRFLWDLRRMIAVWLTITSAHCVIWATATAYRSGLSATATGDSLANSCSMADNRTRLRANSGAKARWETSKTARHRRPPTSTASRKYRLNRSPAARRSSREAPET